MSNLEGIRYFTFPKADGKKEKFNGTGRLFPDYKDNALTLHFTLPLKTRSRRRRVLEVFDPTIFIDFKFR